MPRIESFGGVPLIEMTWEELKPLVDGTSFRLPYVEGVTGKGGCEILALNSNVIYRTELKSDSHKAEWETLKVSALQLEDYAPTHVTDGSTRRLQVESNFPPGQSILLGNQMPSDLQTIVRKLLVDAGDNTNMKVNGSTTPVPFTFGADPNNDVKVSEIRLVLSSPAIRFDFVSFGSIGALTNGVKIEITYGNGTTVVLAEIIKNEDLLLMSSSADAVPSNQGSQDIFVVGLLFGGAPVLKAGTSDKVKVTIRDDLTGGVDELVSLQVQLSGVKV